MESKDKAKKAYSVLKDVFNASELDSFERAINLLRKIVTNIINKPSIDKFRNIRKGNKVLAAKLFIHPKMDELLTIVDFVFDDSEETYTYFSEDTGVLTNLTVILDSFDVEIEAERNNKNVDHEKVNKRRAEVDKECRDKQRELDEIQSKIKTDRIDKNKDLKNNPITDSKAKNRAFGAKVAEVKKILPPPSR